MKKFAIVLFLLPVFLAAQDFNWYINFAGTGASSSVDSVTVENLTQQTSLSFGGNDQLILDVTVGLDDPGDIIANAMQIFPNPAAGSCMVNFLSDATGKATIELFDITGKRIFQSGEILSPGNNSFSLEGLPDGLFILKITSGRNIFSGKIISLNSASAKADIKLSKGDLLPVRSVNIKEENKPDLKNSSEIFEMPYTTGDLLKFRGRSGLHRSVVMLVPTGDRIVTFNFIPCVDAENNHYATVQIGSQFWMAENLNVGAWIAGNQEQADNGIIEKYCYNDEDDYCDAYGALYQWKELMNYETAFGARGICPNGFHIPTDTEWSTMIEFLDGENIAGGKLKESGLDHWFSPNTGATDASGFNALPAGDRSIGGIFSDQGKVAGFWTSLQEGNTSAVYRYMIYTNTHAQINEDVKETGLSCRCIQDDADELTKLCGDTSKTWKLLRDVSTGDYPLQVGPYDHTTIWWAMGYNNQELATRPCLLTDEWTFSRDGSMTFDTKGDVWVEGGIFEPGFFCQNTSDPMININGEDCSAWKDGIHQFSLVTGDDPKLKTIGNGAYIGFYKTATDYEVMDLIPMVQDSITYHLVKLTDGNTDTLIVETPYYFDIGDLQYGGYWRYVLVHYDNPADEPPMPGLMPNASFTVTTDGLTVNCTNTSQNGQNYLWDFGDGQTATTFHATHTYAADSIYIINLTVTNPTGSSSAWQEVFISTVSVTEEMLQGGPWKVRVQDYSIFVGPAMGSNAWWTVPVGYLDGSMIGTPDDWSCMPDDEFTFGPGGVFTYQAYGDVRNDGYFGSPNGCWPESSLVGNALYFASGVRSYSFTPATGNNRPVITLTNGADRAGFIGFYKGYYGGENGYIENPPNGGFSTNTYEVMGFTQTSGKDYLFISVDISADHSGTAAWSAILERQ